MFVKSVYILITYRRFVKFILCAQQRHIIRTIIVTILNDRWNFDPRIRSYLFVHSTSLYESSSAVQKYENLIIDPDIRIYRYKFFFRFDTHSVLASKMCNIPGVGEEANKKYDFDARQAEEIWHLWCPVQNRNPCIIGLSLRMANIYYRTRLRVSGTEIREYRLRRLHSRLPVFEALFCHTFRCQRNLSLCYYKYTLYNDLQSFRLVDLLSVNIKILKKMYISKANEIND